MRQALGQPDAGTHAAVQEIDSRWRLGSTG